MMMIRCMDLNDSRQRGKFTSSLRTAITTEIGRDIDKRLSSGHKSDTRCLQVGCINPRHAKSTFSQMIFNLHGDKWQATFSKNPKMNLHKQGSELCAFQNTADSFNALPPEAQQSFRGSYRLAFHRKLNAPRGTISAYFSDSRVEQNFLSIESHRSHPNFNGWISCHYLK